MNAVKKLWERVKSVFSRQRTEARQKPLTAFQTPGEGSAPPTTALDTQRYTGSDLKVGLADEARAGSLPEMTVRGLTWSAEPGTAQVDAAAINEALCTQCRRYANDIAAQEVL